MRAPEPSQPLPHPHPTHTHTPAPVSAIIAKSQDIGKKIVANLSVPGFHPSSQPFQCSPNSQ